MNHFQSIRQHQVAKVVLVVTVLLSTALLVFLVMVWKGRPIALPKAQLVDGRILQVEGVSFGTFHRIGRKSMIEHFRPWLPQKVNDWLSPKYPYSEIRLDRPALVIWVNAVDAATGKQVDCQGIRVEILGKAGDTYRQETSSWFGGTKFWRVGHVFHAFPREDPTLEVRVTPWRTNVSVSFDVPNPQVTQPAALSGQPLPQHQPVDGLDVALTELLLRTNGSTTRYWESPVRYWLPVWELKQEGKTAMGWEEPEWIAEDPTGNQSQFVGIHHDALRFSVKFYPSPTNTEAPVLIGRSPSMDVSDLQSNIWWNLEFKYHQHRISVLGLFTNGTHIFSDGVYQTNPPIRMAPVRGGAPSGWVGQSQRLTPTRVKYWAGHYTPVPVIYCRAPDLESTERLAVRFRDEQGRYWAAKPEKQGNSQGIRPFLLDPLPQNQPIVAEFLILGPVRAQFLVKIPQQ